MDISRALKRAVVVALAGAGVAAPASAHVQVRPSEAAPEDPVLFEVLVPGERELATTKVELAVPRDTIPFSYGETPGWQRSLTRNRDGSIRTIVWRGRLAPDGLGRFSFLASTPPRQGTIAWKAIQTYADGQKARWIGPRESEQPASFTKVSREVARQNAGGEGADAAAPTAAAPATGAVDEGPDTLARALGGAGLAAGLAALGLALWRRRA